MIIASSAVKMNAQRNFRSMSMWSANVGFVRQLSNTASSSVKQSQPGSGQKPKTAEPAGLAG